MKAAPAKKSRKDMPSETGAVVPRTPSRRSAASDGTMSRVTAMVVMALPARESASAPITQYNGRER